MATALLTAALVGCAIAAAAAAADAKAARKVSRRAAFTHAAKWVKEYKAKENEELRLKRQARALGNFYVPEQPKLAFVIRIRGINDMHP
eukprot:SAG11_NODE_22323_length_408_cov_0.718447_1_plen_88_part_10